jgi:hypothetical protein
MNGKNVGNKDKKEIKEKRLIEKIKESCRNQKLSPKDWEKFYKKIIKQEKKELTLSEKSELKMLLIYEMPSEYRKQVIY